MSEFLRKPDLRPIKGANYATPSIYLGTGENYPRNVQLFRGELKKRDGRTVIGTSMLGGHKVLHLDVLETTAGVQRLIRFSKQNVERYNAGSGLWENITGTDLAGAETDFFDSCNVTEHNLMLFVNNLANAMRLYNDSGNTRDVGGSPPRARTIEYLSPYVLAGNLQEGGDAYPQKVKWCNTGQPETWSGGNSGSALLADETSHIKKIKKLLDYAFVYKEKSVYRGRKVATSAIFDFGGPFTTGKGLGAPRAIADDGANHYYMGLYDFHRNNGVRVSDIGGPVREYIFNRLNRSRINTCFALHVEQYKEVWFFVTVTGQDWPTEVWKYNYETGFWYFDTVDSCLTAAIYKQTVDLTWDTDTDPATWDEEITTWDDQQGASDAPFQVFGYRDGFVDRLNTNVVDDRGAAVASRLETGDYSGIVHNGIEYDTEWMQFDLWARGSGQVKFYYSLDEGSTWTFVRAQDLSVLTDKLTFYFHVVSKHIRFRMDIDGKGEYWTVRNYTPYYLPQPEIWK